MVVGLARPDAGTVFLGDEDITALPMYQRARAGHRLPAAGGERLPQAHRRGERARDPRDARPAGGGAARAGARAARGARDPGAWRASRPTRCREASGGGSRSAARSPRSPSFILLDEPFAGIDPIAVIDIQKIIAHLRDRGIGILITDHNVRETLKITDRAYILRDGNVFRSGTPQRARLGPRGAPRLPRRGLPPRRPRGLRPPPRAEPEPLALHQKLGLSARLSQRLILTPSLQQAIKLLPLTTLELAEVLEQEVMENPLLEEVPVEETQDRSRRSRRRRPTERERERRRPAQGHRRRAVLRGLLRRRRRDRRTRPAEVPEVPPIENTLTESPDLYDHLLWQLHMTESDELTLEIGEAIIQNLDEDGLLRVSLEDVAEMGPCADGGGREGARASCRRSTRPGVAARDLTECLRIQLRVLGLEGSPADVMVRDHMKQLQSHQYPEISRQMGLTPDEVSHHLEIIRGLDPAAGQPLQPRSAPTYILPDVFVVKEGDEYKIVLNDDGLPKLRISPTYKRMLDNKEPGSEETRAYVKDKLRSALWLLKSVDQRQRTIYKVAESIVRHQRALPRPRRHPPAAAGAARRGERHRHARVDGLARGGQQVHAHAARRLRDALLLPQRHHLHHGRGRQLGHDQGPIRR